MTDQRTYHTIGIMAAMLYQEPPDAGTPVEYGEATMRAIKAATTKATMMYKQVQELAAQTVGADG